MFYFYVLKSRLDLKFYYGSTDNLKRRYLEHSSGKVLSTKDRLPLELIYYEAYSTIDLARQREQQVKTSGSIRKSLQNRIESQVDGPARPSARQPGQ